MSEARSPFPSSEPQHGRYRQQNRSSSRPRGPPSESAGVNSDVEGPGEDEVPNVPRRRRERSNIQQVEDATGKLLRKRFAEFLEQ
jgi:DNA replication licensing factor MCM6